MSVSAGFLIKKKSWFWCNHPTNVDRCSGSTTPGCCCAVANATSCGPPRPRVRRPGSRYRWSRRCRLGRRLRQTRPWRWCRRWRCECGRAERSCCCSEAEKEFKKSTKLTEKRFLSALTTFAVMPYSLLAPSVCICDLRRSAITEFLRTSSARIVSRRIVIRRVRIGVLGLFASAVSFKNRFLNATSKVPICRRVCRAFSKLWTVRRRAILSGPLPESLS